MKKLIVSAARLDEDFVRDEDDPSFAIGIGLTEKDDDYVLAIRVETEADKSRVIGRYEKLWFDKRIEADVRVIGRERLRLADDRRQEVAGQPLAIGASVSHFKELSGTLGFFAKRKGVKGFVSCNHVIALEDGAKDGDPILSPGTSDNGTDPDDHAGKLVFAASLHGGGRKIADCAFAEADPARLPTNTRILGRDGNLINRQVFIRRRLRVIKIGRSSHRTEGRITAGNLDHFAADFATLSVKFNDVYEVETTDLGRDPDPFCEEGDSGALVYTANREPVGLLFYKAPTGGPGNSGLGYLNPFDNVLRALNAQLL
ncbi:MAG TPA: hypothetical protein VN181_07785 [Thermoanaerobaculia bacterium]|nr:hypothetical protein [Thermoanaerobaculia bacterium]